MRHTHTHTHTGRGGVKTLVQCDGSGKMLSLCKSGLVNDIQAHTVLADEEVFFFALSVYTDQSCVCVFMCPTLVLKEEERERERERYDESERETMGEREREMA